MVQTDIHPIIMNHRRDIEETMNVYDFERAVIPPIPKKDIEVESKTIVKFSMDMYVPHVVVDHGKHGPKVAADFFIRLAKLKCQSIPPLPAEMAQRRPAKPIDQLTPIFERLYSQRPVRHIMPTENDKYPSKHASIGQAKIQRLAQPKVVKREPTNPLPKIPMRTNDIADLVTRLAKPKYYIVWKMKEEKEE
ncbi:hypothetical protein BC830DRAFT_1090214 [Chytriomyces sp. MP71]|nr:hypothetical protein BC830DRAFT_1090214 [Chytriomyces sp. MP71]